ncbi:hypothetical protein [Mesorhizobium captivum]|uniref:hypothetical protein n=1 Tax=Mesorhizobium captivum TaxID=3072319 RepID=UPI002A240E08|nr:hypothetical protein [Mesorhizobium sp. VK3C]MDX8447285.1 hypothetical protein [Mesorhizobium sp. VK3C]
MIPSLFRHGAAWAPATVSADGNALFTPDFVLELTRLHLSGNGQQSSVRLNEILENPELRLGYELVPEIIAEYALRGISAPRSFKYLLRDRDGRHKSFEVALHPIVPLVHHVLENQLVPQSAVSIIAKGSSYADAVSKALNAGEALADLSIAVAPIGLGLHREKLEITEGC